MATSVATITPGFSFSEALNVRVYNTAGAASRTFAAASAFHSGVQKISLAWDLRNLRNLLCSFLDGLYERCESAELGKNASGSATPPTREQMESTIRTLEYLYDTINRTYATSRKKGLTNSSMMAGSLHTIHRRSEELLDIADWIRTALAYTPSEIDDLYRNARQDLERGEVVELGQVK